ncbi:MAG: molybdopterin molybdenumtransferase MoeA, partial [Rubrivivax sp.]
LDLFPNQSSGVLTSTVWADGLVDVPALQPIARGDMVRFLPLNGLLG